MATNVRDLRFQSKDFMEVYRDNKVAVNIAHNLVQHDGTKYIEIDKHLIKEKLNEGIICIPFGEFGE